jgi:hypothetical protein
MDSYEFLMKTGFGSNKRSISQVLPKNLLGMTARPNTKFTGCGHSEFYSVDVWMLSTSSDIRQLGPTLKSSASGLQQ